MTSVQPFFLCVEGCRQLSWLLAVALSPLLVLMVGIDYCYVTTFAHVLSVVRVYG